MNDDPPRIDEYDVGAVPTVEPQPIVATRIMRALREIEPSFSDAVRDMELASIVIDLDGRIAFCSDYLLRLTGWKLEEVIGRSFPEIFLRAGRVAAPARGTMPSGDAPAQWTHDNEIFTRAGERRLIRWNSVALRSRAGEQIGTASIGEDVTGRKRAEERIAYLLRVNATLSGINTLIVRVRARDELFRQACRIAVAQGGFLLAVIAIVDHGGSRLAAVVVDGKDKRAVCAAEEILSASAGALTEMIKQAIREKTPIVANDSRNDERVAFRARHIEFDCNSMVVIPLMAADLVVGVLVLYAAETEFFLDEEMRLLMEVAGDISFAIDHIEKQERYDYLCYYDALTGLANRGLFVDRLAQQMRAAAGGGYRLALLVIDLERFKDINDTLGRASGDALLRQVADWLTQAAGDAALLTRFDGDQFGMMLPQVKRGEEVAHAVGRMLDDLSSHSFRLNDVAFRIVAKVGVALSPDDGADANVLCQHAEAALKKAKSNRDPYLFYAQRMTRAVAGRLALENQLRLAYERKEFVLHYQPKVKIKTGQVTGAEALIRWNDPATGLVPPGKFIPVLEETGLIYEVGRWAMSQAIEDYLRWDSAGLAAVPIAVNVSPLQLQHRDFVATVKQAIDVDARAASAVELEITESMLMQDINHNVANLNAIRALGVGIAIDDFGTGFSSLSYLTKLPLDTLKIDRSFVHEVNAGPEGLAIVSTIIGLAHSLNLKVVAEGVETDEQWRALESLNCDEMQGYLFSKPLPVAIFEKRYLRKIRDR
jgi:diguanylate cyclase (GGDEF)-like protein/PAS domain S-box-containing protein